MEKQKDLREWVMVGVKKLYFKDVKLGMICRFPSGAGGTVSYKCVTLDESKAVFSPVDPWFEGKGHDLNIDFGISDFKFFEFEKLQRYFESADINQRCEFESLLHRACLLGYAFKLSWTQVGWTEMGSSKYREALQKITNLTPKEMGVRAFHMGLNAPFQDQLLTDYLVANRVPVGEGVPIFEMWRKGFFGEVDAL